MTTKNTYSKSEVGHIKNLEYFYDLIQICKRYGDSYAPVAADIKIENLETANATFTQKQFEVNEQSANLTVKINERQHQFEKLRPLTTRVMNALAVATDDTKIVADARKFANKIQGKEPKVKTNDDQVGQEVKEPKSNSQRSYDKLMEHLENLILIIKNVPEYEPNETELTIPELENYLTQLRDVDRQFSQAQVAYQKALTQRDNTLYHENSGLVARAQKVKKYVQSVFGFNSLEFKEIKKLPFRTYKRR